MNLEELENKIREYCKRLNQAIDERDEAIEIIIELKGFYIEQKNFRDLMLSSDLPEQTELLHKIGKYTLYEDGKQFRKDANKRIRERGLDKRLLYQEKI